MLIKCSGVGAYFLACELAYLAQKGASQTLARGSHIFVSLCIILHNLHLLTSLLGGIMNYLMDHFFMKIVSD